MEMIPVESSNIDSVGYDEKTLDLRVKFKTGKIYEYHLFPIELFNDFSSSESKGKFFAKNIRPIFKGVVVPEPEKEIDRKASDIV